MKGGKAGRKRPPNAPTPPPPKQGPSRGERKKEWGPSEKDESPLPSLPEPRRKS